MSGWRSKKKGKMILGINKTKNRREVISKLKALEFCKCKECSNCNTNKGNDNYYYNVAGSSGSRVFTAIKSRSHLIVRGIEIRR